MPVIVTMKLLTAGDLAAAWKVSRKTILRWRREGKIREVTRGRYNEYLFSSAVTPPYGVAPWKVEALFGAGKKTVQQWGNWGTLDFSLTKEGGIRRYHTESVFQLLVDCKIELLTLGEAANLFNVSRQTLNDLDEAGKIASIRIDHQVLYTSMSIAAALGIPNPFYLTSEQAAALARRNKSRILSWAQRGLIRSAKGPYHKRLIPASAIPFIISHSWTPEDAAIAASVPPLVTRLWEHHGWLDPDPDNPGPPDARKYRYRKPQRA